MATKKIKGSTTINITKKSKDATYAIDESVVGTAKVSFINSLPVPGMPIPIENSDDLGLLFVNDYKVNIEEEYEINKYILVTIKDYYKYYETNPDLILTNNGSVHDKAKTELDAGNYITHNKKFEGALTSDVLGDKKNNTYNITQVTKKDPENELGVMDIGGNDKYTVAVPYSETDNNSLFISEISGNDKFTIKSGTFAQIIDQVGKDTYNIEDSYAAVEDYEGNDKYTLTNAQGTYITDYSGKDSYTVNGKNTETVPTIIVDLAGKDKYTVSNVTGFALKDMEGNDTYKLTNVQVTDKDKEIDYDNTLIGDSIGNDKYTVSGSDTYLYINDKMGKDTYNIKGTYDKKTKTATYVGYTEIKDEGTGKNTFNLNYAEHTDIIALNGTNVYNIKNSNYVSILSNAEDEVTGSDKYTLTSNNYFDIDDLGATADSYKMTKSWAGEIYDKAGNDTYTIDSLQLKPYDADDRYAGIAISDNAGDKDSLVLKGTKANNIVFMSDFYYDEAHEKYESSGDSLIIYDKSTGGYAYITNFYKTDKTSYDFDGFGYGLIETIKAKSKKLDVSTNTEYYTKMNNVKEEVVTWLTNQTAEGFDGNFSYVEDVLKFGTDEQKETLTAYFDPKG